MVTKQCSKCGADFGCNATGTGCWCEQYSLSTQTLAELKNDYNNCLCPQCLEQYAEKEPLSGKQE